MGEKYNGGASYWRAIGQNLMVVKNTYGFSNGYFGNNDGKSTNSVRTIWCEDPEKAARDFYGKLSYGGDDISKNGVTMSKMHDGTIITFRIKTSSKGSPAVDINITKSRGSADIKTQKVHFANKEED